MWQKSEPTEHMRPLESVMIIRVPFLQWRRLQSRSDAVLKVGQMKVENTQILIVYVDLA